MGIHAINISPPRKYHLVLYFSRNSNTRWRQATLLLTSDGASVHPAGLKGLLGVIYMYIQRAPPLKDRVFLSAARFLFF